MTVMRFNYNAKQVNILRDIQPLIARTWVQLLILLAVGLALRIATFGDPNISPDEAFYLLVGHEMHHGAIPYVDIWDRKPLGLFILYWLFAFVPNSVIAYQIGAWLSASATAFVMSRIATRWMTPGASLIAGLLYLVTLNVIGGQGGQSPVFYNLFVAGGALLVFQYIKGGATWRLLVAMFLLGIAITFKQTAAFESAFLGLAAVWHHRDWRMAVLQIVIGSAPFLAIAAWYLAAGYGPEFYHAMVTASTMRPTMAPVLKALKITIMLANIGPLIGLAIYALNFCRNWLDIRLIGTWLGAAVVGWASAGYFYDHYALPMLVPLCIIAGAAWTRRPAGPVLIMIALLVPFYLASPFDFERHRQSREQFDAMVRAIGPLPGGTGLLLVSGPSLLYVAVHAHPMSQLVFPDHFTAQHERDMWPRKTGPELERLIALRPSAIVTYDGNYIPSDFPALRHLLEYVRTRCRPPVRTTTYMYQGPELHPLVYSGCS